MAQRTDNSACVGVIGMILTAAIRRIGAGPDNLCDAHHAQMECRSVTRKPARDLSERFLGFITRGNNKLKNLSLAHPIETDGEAVGRNRRRIFRNVFQILLHSVKQTPDNLRGRTRTGTEMDCVNRNPSGIFRKDFSISVNQGGQNRENLSLRVPSAIETAPVKQESSRSFRGQKTAISGQNRTYLRRIFTFVRQRKESAIEIRENLSERLFQTFTETPISRNSIFPKTRGGDRNTRCAIRSGENLSERLFGSFPSHSISRKLILSKTDGANRNEADVMNGGKNLPERSRRTFRRAGISADCVFAKTEARYRYKADAIRWARNLSGRLYRLADRKTQDPYQIFAITGDA